MIDRAAAAGDAEAITFRKRHQASLRQSTARMARLLREYPKLAGVTPEWWIVIDPHETERARRAAARRQARAYVPATPYNDGLEALFAAAIFNTGVQAMMADKALTVRTLSKWLNAHLNRDARLRLRQAHARLPKGQAGRPTDDPERLEADIRRAIAELREIGLPVTQPAVAERLHVDTNTIKYRIKTRIAKPWAELKR